jgi:hypothetical protein
MSIEGVEGALIGRRVVGFAAIERGAVPAFGYDCTDLVPHEEQASPSRSEYVFSGETP